MLHRKAVVALLLVLPLAGCGISDPSTNASNSFSGTLQQNSSNAHGFSTSKNGEIFVTVTSMTPAPANSGTAPLITLGQGTGSACASAAVALGQPVVVNRQVQFGFLNKGSYCVILFDNGQMTAATTYAGTVSHP